MMISTKLLTTGLFATLFAGICTKGHAVDEGQKFVDGVGVYVYKSAHPFSEHIRNFIELNNGAHYYVQSHYSNVYWNVIGTIELPDDQDLDLKDRIACLSLNVLSDGTNLDMGVENKGTGWFPFWYAGYANEGSPETPAYANAKRVRFIIIANNDDGYDTVTGYFTFLDKDDEEIQMEKMTFTKPYGEFFDTHDGRPLLRFGRFVSLLPGYGANRAEDDMADGSYMRNAGFSDLQLYHRDNGYQVWNMNLIEHAWSVQTANIQDLQISPYDTGSDSIDMSHTYQYDFTYTGVILKLVTDRWPGETSFEISDSQMQPIYAESGFNEQWKEYVFTYDNLGDSTQYNLLLQDSWGDGFQGSITIFGLSTDGGQGSMLFQYSGDDSSFRQKVFSFSMVD